MSYATYVMNIFTRYLFIIIFFKYINAFISLNTKYVFEYNIYYNGGHFNAFHTSLKTVLANFSIEKFILRKSTFTHFNLMYV